MSGWQNDNEITLYATLNKEGILKSIRIIESLCREIERESYKLSRAINVTDTPSTEERGGESTDDPDT